MEERAKAEEVPPGDTCGRDRSKLSLPFTNQLAAVRFGEKFTSRLRDTILNIGEEDGNQELHSSAQELLAFLSCLSDSPDRFSGFPRILHTFELAIREVEESSKDGIVQPCIQEAKKFVAQMLSDIADHLISISDITVQQPFESIGTGSYNWALTDKSKVILISKQLDEEPLKAYKLRKLGADLMNQAGLNQPTVHSVKAEPFPHMIMEFSKGRSLYQCISESPDSENREVALSALARFLRQCAKIELPGYGHLSEIDGQVVCANETKKDGLQWLLRRFASPNNTEKQIDQAFQELDLLPESVLDTLRECAEEILAFDETSMLANGDPNPSNFLYNRDNDRIIALDLDMLYAASPSEFFGFLYQSWVLHGLTTEDNYFRVLEEFEPNPERRKILYKQALSIAATFSYIYAHNIYTRDDTRKAAALRETPALFLNFTRIALEKKQAA